MSGQENDQGDFDAIAEEARHAVKQAVIRRIEAADDDDPKAVHAIMSGTLAAVCELWAAFAAPGTTRARLAEALGKASSTLAKQAFDRLRSETMQ